MTVVPLITSIVSLIFAVLVLDQFFAHRRPYQLVWCLGLLMYTISAGSEFIANNSGITEAVYKTWYLFGAILVAAWLGMGTLYLLLKRGTANVIMIILAGISVYAAFKVLTVDIDVTGMTGLEAGIMPGGIVALTVILNIFGTLALAGGALYSAWFFWRKRLMKHRVTSNILIAFGAILPAMGGTNMRLSGDMTLFYFLELAGIIIIFLGFLRSNEVFGVARFPLIHGFARIDARK
ncbi:hypothetical protein Dform_01103 [Dehalogenimonas formicexedens]|uniref:Uncharacterized protein n=1 Tax=Dehalogenimonas formicexedens TaxID=1839801 RepID=A0A1P8F7J0_9CHLR|nr:hypothetical protein [Dehalogenimonas formicexedens]APV44437.1 hypothetical protein Dform_01103 [Dehalogenimonas formicexedens]